MGNFTFHEDVLSNVIVFSIGATSLWSGRGKLTAEDLGDLADDLPPAALASLGSKRLFPREEIKKLESFKRKMARIIASYGTPFLNGRAVPVDMAEQCARELDAIVDQARAAVDEFMKHFDANLRDWHDANKQWAHLLAAGTPEREAVRKRINFGFDAYPVGVPDGQWLAAKMTSAIGSLGSNLFNDIAKDARDFVKKALTNRAIVASQKTVNPIRRLQQKLKSLSFLNHRAVPVIKVTELLMAQLPTKGKLTEREYFLLVQVAHMLSDVKQMEAVAEEILGGVSVEAVAERISGEKLAITPALQAEISGTVATEAQKAEDEEGVDAALLLVASTTADAQPDAEAVRQEQLVAATPAPTLLLAQSDKQKPASSRKPAVPDAPKQPAAPRINPMRAIAF